MKEKHVYVSLDNFDTVELKQAAKEHRLIVKIIVDENDEQALLDYVSRIDDCATPRWRGHTAELWQAMIAAPVEKLFLRRGEQKGQPNRSRIIALVEWLQNNGIYRQKFSSLQLHLKMEQSTKRNSQYCNKAKYAPETLEERELLKDIIRQVNV